MKYLLSILAVISIGLFASCGGEKECCGKCSDDTNKTAEDNGSK